ncbi:MAG: hypothetical protein AAB893_00465, partial [Patescibacteria group bacterium]
MDATLNGEFSSLFQNNITKEGPSAYEISLLTGPFNIQKTTSQAIEIPELNPKDKDGIQKFNTASKLTITEGDKQKDGEYLSEFLINHTEKIVAELFKAGVISTQDFQDLKRLFPSHDFSFMSIEKGKLKFEYGYTNNTLSRSQQLDLLILINFKLRAGNTTNKVLHTLVSNVMPILLKSENKSQKNGMVDESIILRALQIASYYAQEERTKEKFFHATTAMPGQERTSVGNEVVESTTKKKDADIIRSIRGKLKVLAQITDSKDSMHSYETDYFSS